jgi:hypothetical protein
VSAGPIDPAAPTGTEGSDDALLYLLAETKRLWEEWSRHVPSAALPVPAARTWSEPMLKAAAMPAHTLEGIRAKAGILHIVILDGKAALGPWAHPDEFLALSLCRDIAQMTHEGGLGA